MKLVENAINPSQPPPIPGPEQCKFCRAKLICKAAYRETIQELAMHRLSTPARTGEFVDIHQEIQTIDDGRLDQMGNAWEVAQLIGKAIDAEIKRRKEADPDSMPNYAWRDNGRMPRCRRRIWRGRILAIC